MMDIVLVVLVFVVASVAGYLLISRVPQQLHTPLMSMTNAISGVTIIGAVLLFSLDGDVFSLVLGGAAVVLAAFNLVGGFAITNRMLAMFRTKDRDAG